MRDALIVSTARTPIGKAFRGAFNNTEAPVLAGHAVKHAVARAGIDGGMVDDVILGCAAQQGSQAYNIGRLATYTAGLPRTVSGATVDRQCSSGMMAIAMAAQSILTNNADVAVGGGVESISLVQTKHKNTYRAVSQAAVEAVPKAYIQMIETAEIVAERYGVSREAQDEYSAQSQARTAAAQAAGKFDDEIVPMATKMKLVDRETKEETIVDYVVDKDVFVIGRGTKETDLTIRDGNISRKHAAVIFKDGKFYIQDLGSTNGIDYAGNRIDTKRIQDGDEYFICEHRLNFRFD